MSRLMSILFRAISGRRLPKQHPTGGCLIALPVASPHEALGVMQRPCELTPKGFEKELKLERRERVALPAARRQPDFLAASETGFSRRLRDG